MEEQDGTSSGHLSVLYKLVVYRGNAFDDRELAAWRQEGWTKPLANEKL